MKKFHIALLLLGVTFFLGALDFTLSHPKWPKAPTVGEIPQVLGTPANLTQNLLSLDPAGFGYVITSRTRTQLLFDKIDISEIKNTISFRSELTSAEKPPITLYEILGPQGQGSVTYLNLKLKFLKIKDATTDINEVGTYGHNSFFFNDKNQEGTAFLVTLVGDNLLGFQYNKQAPDAFETIKTMIQAYTASLPK
jgi:hypothetical protein